MTIFSIEPIGWIRSELRSAAAAPKQGTEGAPDVWLEVDPRFEPAMRTVRTGDRLVVLTWLHEARRDLLEVHPRDDMSNPLTGVFSTRSADRPNPIGLHPVIVREIEGTRLRMGPMEAIDGTPVIDLKPQLSGDAL